MLAAAVARVGLVFALGLGASPASAAPPPDDTVLADISVLGAIEREQTALFQRVAPSVVFIAGADGFGSGFFVSNRGHILTNRHVVEGMKEVRVVTHDGRRFKGKVVAQGDDGLDLAVVKIAAKRTPPITMVSSQGSPIGSWVGSVGHGRGGIWTLSTGSVSNAWGNANTGGVLQTQIPLNPGGSGGPVFDRYGRVIGIVTAGLSDAQAINFAIRTDTAIQRLPYLRSFVDCVVVEAEAGAAIQVDGHFVGKGPSMALFVEPGQHTFSAVHQGRRHKRKADVPRQRIVNLRAR